MNEKNTTEKRNLFRFKDEWPVLLFLLLAVIAGIAAYPHLPSEVPGHWNISGQVDRYMPRVWGAFGTTLLAAVIYFLMLVTPALDPKRENYARFAGAYRVIRLGIVILLLLLQGIVLAAGLGYSVRVDIWVPLMISILFILMGNQMGRVRFNYFVGLRNPWTLSSEQVWRKAHHFGAWIFVMMGFIGLGAAFLPVPFNAWVFFTAMVAGLVAITIYSYLVYRQEQSVK